ncbi:MAG: hypothetical protein U0670_19720 [Anaerolineae bacterium]
MGQARELYWQLFNIAANKRSLAMNIQLQDVDWKSMRHARGHAGDIPQLLSDLTADDLDKQKTAALTLRAVLESQNVSYEPGFYAIPVLINVLDDEACMSKELVLDILLAILNGRTWKELFVVNEEIRSGRVDPEIYKVDLLRMGLDTYKRLTKSSEFEVRLRSVDLIVATAPPTDEHIRFLITSFETEPDEALKAITVGLIGYVLAKRDRDDIDEYMQFLRRESTNSSYKISIRAFGAIIVAEKHRPDIGTLAGLLERIDGSKSALADDDWVLINIINRVGDLLSPFDVVILMQLSQYAKTRHALVMVFNPLLNKLFLEVDPRSKLIVPVAKEDLTFYQRWLLQTILANNGFWEEELNEDQLIYFALPTTREALIELIT